MIGPRIRCPNCGFENPSDSNFCERCGSSVEQQPAYPSAKPAQPLPPLPPTPPSPAPVQRAVAPPGISACYQLVARDSALTISEPQRVFGRFDFINLVSPEDAGLVSRQHFSIKFEERKFYVQDVGSKNGTKINYGEDIRAKGWLEIKPNDVISVAGVLDLKFVTVEATKCSFCDYPNKPDAVFCEHCGRPLKPEAAGGGDVPRPPLQS